MVNTYKQRLTILQEDILRFLFKNVGLPATARKISLELNVSQPAISKSLPLLQKKEWVIVNKDKETKRLSIELNIENKKIIQLKRADNLKQIYESGVLDFLSSTFPGSTIILFGSYSFGEDTITSDIDLAIIGAKQKDLNLKSYKDHLKRELILNFYSSLKNIEPELRNNILNGILLHGAVSL